jgi:hypothetical protein
MKKIITLLAIGFFGLTACQQKGNNEEVSNSDSTSVESGAFGAKIDEAGAITMDSLIAFVEANNGAVENVKVQGKINECCQTKGCWMNVEKGDGTGMRVTFKDYAFFVPKNAGGKDAVFSGKAYMDTTSVDDLKHFAMDEGLSKEEIEKITQPKVELAFEAEGVIIK